MNITRYLCIQFWTHRSNSMQSRKQRTTTNFKSFGKQKKKRKNKWLPIWDETENVQKYLFNYIERKCWSVRWTNREMEKEKWMKKSLKSVTKLFQGTLTQQNCSAKENQLSVSKSIMILQKKKTREKGKKRTWKSHIQRIFIFDHSSKGTENRKIMTFEGKWWKPFDKGGKDSKWRK